MQDLSEGKERIPITVFNDIDDSLPEKFRYWTTYSGMIPEDPKRLVRCDCEGDCRNPDKECDCMELTLKEWRTHRKLGSSCADDDKATEDDATYSYRRLFLKNESGIYECNRL